MFEGSVLRRWRADGQTFDESVRHAGKRRSAGPMSEARRECGAAHKTFNRQFDEWSTLRAWVAA